MAKLETGTIIDRYVVEGLLGKGGMAVVYRVRHKDLDSTHALKVLTVHSDSIRERLHQEGKAQAKLRHPNIVSVTDLVDVHGSPGLIMECVEGPDLSQVLPLIQRDLELADTIARGIISGVLEAHRLGLVHRDLKPANILISKQGDRPVPKVTDFGLVKLLMADSEVSHPTQAGSTMGTPAYMAPEQIRDPSLVDARADLFSLGVILYELVCGEKPFQGSDMLELFTSITAGKFRPPRELRPDLPERMEAAILGALEVQREQRIPDCRVLFEVWEGRRVDWRAMALVSEPSDRDPSWNSVLGAAWDRSEQSASMTAVPSSMEPGVRPTHPPRPGPADSEPSVGDPPAAGGVAEETYYHPPPEAQDDLPSQVVVPAEAAPAAAPQAEPSVVEPPPAKRSVLPWALGAAALLALTVGGALLMLDKPDPVAPPQPEPVVSQPEPTPPEPEPIVEPEPEPDIEPSEPEPVAGPAPVSPAPVVATAQPEPAAPPEPEPEPEPEPIVEPAAVPTTASVSVEGGVRIWLVGSAGRFPPGEVPPGTYAIKAFFDPMQPLDAGSFEATAGDQLVVKCSTAMQRCTAAPR